ncbi:MAG TPA: ATP-binding cassette domain-containing protein [Pseudomonadales bacterium]|jgi:ABC-type lipoprotein export system ATPase subunit|nr:ATP-binding cassette domain-containing protein [Pseudomonadales bacterium]MDP6317640.1 ATP-binding cassette domain-containing protein [Pseudomonadales bacterium]HJL62154.1 ATP-binding cassette domain-containing protein [Pseudomonadales bacterium]HJP51165.1 ATP-binding cassette domain-containing protein [Pseudomonadales bacterium]|tara:strand:- start:1968 stop:2621 length:654 start_codon:yes stop_codon:yes gene_type:complete
MSLSIRNLHIEYPGQRVFDSLSLDFEDNEIIAIEKHVLDGGTSLLQGIGGFLNDVGGESNLNGVDLLHCSPAERATRVGYVYEDQGLVSLYSIYQNIVLPLQFHTDLSDDKIHEQASAVCASLNLSEALFSDHPHQLNDVQTRLVNLARGLIINPELLLIDELEGGMSEAYLHDTMATLRDKQKTSPMTIIVTTSDDFVMEKADRIFRIQDHDLIAE